MSIEEAIVAAFFLWFLYEMFKTMLAITESHVARRRELSDDEA